MIISAAAADGGVDSIRQNLCRPAAAAAEMIGFLVLWRQRPGQTESGEEGGSSCLQVVSDAPLINDLTTDN